MNAWLGVASAEHLSLTSTPNWGHQLRRAFVALDAAAFCALVAGGTYPDDVVRQSEER